MNELLPLLTASLAERYTVEREVGRGGMATVYLARDVRHGRAVAVKVLHPQLAVSLGADRFLREIQIAAGLQHSHIVPLYDSGRAGDLLYYVMPFIDGESLRQRLDRDGRFPIDEALQIARAVASALDYAHRRQVVHRDIKPENVMLQDGEAMVTDFGIAKAVSAASGASLTQTGSAMGTPSYMSPEQASGEADLDGRSDVYSLGAMLFEMVTGSAPFTGPTMQAIVSKLFTQPVPSARAQRNEIPEWLDEALLRALSKDKVDRYATAAMFAQALVWPTGGSTPPGMPAGSSGGKSIAVLPFVNMSADPENEYFTDGIAEEIINALTKVQSLRVASRTSSFAFKGKSEDISGIGRKLRVTTVLEGSVRKSGDRLRVSAQLVNVADGSNLWSERFDRKLEDVFEIQDEIAGAIVKALRVVLSDEEKRAIEKPATENVQAYEYYLRGRQYFHSWSRTSIQYARRMFERAIELDPRYATAHAGIADCCSYLYMYWDGSKANLDGADAASHKALELDPELADAHVARGFALTLRREYDEARRELDRATQLNPKLYEAHYQYARLCVQEGKLAEAVSHFQAASNTRPEDFQALFLMSSSLHGLGRSEEARAAAQAGLRVAEKHLELNPDDSRALYLSATAMIQLGPTERERALEWAARARAANQSDSMVLYNVACVYARGEMSDAAMECLDLAIQNGFGHRQWLDNDSDLDSLRGDARFKALLQKL